MLEFLKVVAFYLMYFGHLCNFMMSLYVSSEICLWRLWDLSCFQILSMNLSSTQTTVRAANRFGVGFSPGRTHVSGNARGNVSRVVTWLMIGPLVELRLDLFYIEIRIVTLCNLICLEFIVCKCRFCSEFVSLSICVASCTKSCRRPSVRPSVRVKKCHHTSLIFVQFYCPGVH